MQSPIVIRKEGKQIKVNFSYNSDLVEIMRSHNGYFFRKEKAWCFPMFKLDIIRDELIKKMYQVKVTTSNVKQEPKVIKKSYPFEDPTVVSVYGKCEKCGKGEFIGKDGLCVRCWSANRNKRKVFK